MTSDQTLKRRDAGSSYGLYSVVVETSLFIRPLFQWKKTHFNLSGGAAASSVVFGCVLAVSTMESEFANVAKNTHSIFVDIFYPEVGLETGVECSGDGMMVA